MSKSVKNAAAIKIAYIGGESRAWAHSLIPVGRYNHALIDRPMGAP